MIEFMESAIKTVMNLPSLSPSPSVNAAFSVLVEQVVHVESLPSWCDAGLLYGIQQRCAESEAEMELYWAKRIINSARPLQELERFWYIDNYRELVRREIGLLSGSGVRLGQFSRVAVIGSGPLPLTAWCFCQQVGAQIDLIDSSVEAIKTSNALAGALDWSAKGVVANGSTVNLAAASYDIIYVAGLAGDSLAAKQQIVDNVRPALKRHGRLVMRSASGAKTLLYPSFAADSLKNVELLVEYHPDDDIINSVFIYKNRSKHE